MKKNTIRTVRQNGDFSLRLRRECSSLADWFKADPWKGSLFFFTMGILALALLVPFTQWRGKSILDAAMPLLALFFAGALAAQKRLINGAASALLLAYALWFTGTRILLSDTGFGDSIYRIGIISCTAVMFFNLPFFFTSGNSRRKLRAIVADAGIAFCVLTVFFSFFVIVFGKNITLGNWYNLKDSFFMLRNRLFCFGDYPNIVAQVLCIGVCMALIRAMEVRNRIFSVVYILAAAFIMAGMSMTDCRASSYVTCAVLAAAAGLVFFRVMRGRMNGNKGYAAVKIAAGILCGVIVFFGANSYIDGSKAVIEKISASVRTSAETVSPDSNAPDIIEPEGFVVSDREYHGVEEILSMNGRTTIYAAAIKQLKDTPQTLIFGEIYSSETFYISAYHNSHWEIWNWHNSFIELVFESGLVGLGLIVAFVVIILIKICTVFFGSFDRYSVAQKFAVSIPAASLLLSMIEPSLFSSDFTLMLVVFYLMFILWCGMTASEVDRHKTAVKVSSTKEE